MKTNAITNQQFKGLILKNKYKDTYIMGNNRIHYIKDEYFPFKDESQKEIENFVRNRERIITSNKIPVFDVIRKVIVRDALPFTLEEFKLYKSDTNYAKHQFVEKGLINNQLYKYLNNTGVKETSLIEKFVSFAKKFLK